MIAADGRCALLRTPTLDWIGARAIIKRSDVGRIRRVAVVRLYKHLERYWRGNPIWMPFVIVLLVPLFLAGKPGMLGYITGTHVGSSPPSTVSGAFEPRPSTFSPYRFRTASGRDLRLSCQAHERFVTCLDGKPVFGRVVDVTFAPKKGSFYNASDGMISKISSHGSTLMSNEEHHVKLGLLASIVIPFLDLIMLSTKVIIFSTVAFIVIGLITSFKRIFGGAQTHDA